MAAMSPAAAKYFCDNFAGQSLRSMRQQRQKNGGQLDDGIVLKHFERVSGYIKDLGYTGPLVLAPDQTSSATLLKNNFNQSTLQQASYDKETAEEIAASHISVLDYCSKAGMSIISIGSDGAATEILALRFVQKSVKQFLCFHKLDARISVQVPMIGETPRPLVPVQDPKHAQKTASNQLLSGAQVLSFGKYFLNISQLVELLGQSSPLYSRDVLNCNKQDNGRAYRTMNWETFEASLISPQHTGLSIYLYLFGVAISDSANYDFAYACVPDKTPISEIMHEAATSIGEKQKADLALADIDIEEEHDWLSCKNQMSISSLLNPLTEKPPSLSTTFLAERSKEKFQLVIKTPDGSDTQLNHQLMLELRKKQNTENCHHHSGNKKQKRQNFLLAPNQSQSDSNKAPQPSECSKLVSLVLKENMSQQSSIARMHQWNIQVQFNLLEVQKTSTHVDVSAQMLVQGGAVSKTNELIYGKFGIFIKEKRIA
ncbi:hypothetical protein PCANC_24324 [Puccinia coronata f. sp. avenae]|uniref:Uncharacterized protein n=1 Tax=Puccinia coronata f. sp. avenae TaxID=200324 RepID=A0A2N5S6Q7_9BASI|nr:hypothetical protein PCANC_24324 [Puccinia coronata f. sp. avenae]